MNGQPGLNMCGTCGQQYSDKKECGHNEPQQEQKSECCGAELIECEKKSQTLFCLACDKHYHKAIQKTTKETLEMRCEKFLTENSPYKIGSPFGVKFQDFIRAELKAKEKEFVQDLKSISTLVVHKMAKEYIKDTISKYSKE